MKKVIILLTDGAQNPDKKDFDPVAKSQKLFDDGVKIFAVSVLYFLMVRQSNSYITHGSLLLKQNNKTMVY